MPAKQSFTTLALAMSLTCTSLYAEEQIPGFKIPDDVVFRTDNIMSEGTRMAAEVFAPKNAASDEAPTIVMSHGWGGTAAQLRPDGVAFARAGLFGGNVRLSRLGQERLAAGAG